MNEFPLIYTQSLRYAVEHNERELYLDSHKVNTDCASALYVSIGNNYNYENSHFDSAKVLDEITTQFGYERTAFILSAHIHRHNHDGRFDTATKEWAHDNMSKYSEAFIESCREYYINSHAGLINIMAKQCIEHEIVQKAQENLVEPILLDDYEGEWRIAAATVKRGKAYFELESINYGYTDQVGHIIVNENREVIADDVHDGFKVLNSTTAPKATAKNTYERE